MLDDTNVLNQRDPHGALAVAADEINQLRFEAEVQDGDHDGRTLTRVVYTGMGGSALAAAVVARWLSDTLAVPFELVRNYDLPHYVDASTLVIAASYSGNTEESLSALQHARDAGAQVAIISAGGELVDIAQREHIAHIRLPSGLQPRMTLLYFLRAITRLLAHFELVDHAPYESLAAAYDELLPLVAQWGRNVPTERNYAKQLAVVAVGKTPVIYGGWLTAPVAYKWKISWNENAKNVAFCNEYPEANHNEFLGWTSHPVDKPFAIFDLVSSYEHERIKLRFELTDRLLSGMRPKSNVVDLVGSSPIAQLVWGCILADYASIYVAILNGVDPVPVEIIERLKHELAAQ